MSNDFLLMFKQSYTLVPIIMLLVALLTFIDSKITDKKVSMSSYSKLVIGAGLITIFIIYVNTIKGYVQEEILTGTPPF